MMDLILWRHAHARDLVEGEEDIQRPLTPRGEKQAAHMAAWLRKHLPDGLRVLASPAVRTEQTVKALNRKYKLRAELLPDGLPQDLLELAQWPSAQGTVLVVGHQPVLGQTIAELVGFTGAECSVRKGAVWWLRHRVRDGAVEVVLVAVRGPDEL